MNSGKYPSMSKFSDEPDVDANGGKRARVLNAVEADERTSQFLTMNASIPSGILATSTSPQDTTLQAHPYVFAMKDLGRLPMPWLQRSGDNHF